MLAVIIQWYAVSCNEHTVFCEFRAHGLLKSTAQSWPVVSLRGLRQCMPIHALTFTKHKQPMFNYYNKLVVSKMSDIFFKQKHFICVE